MSFGEGALLMMHDPSNLAEQHWDVLIIGGGIVGAGVARDAAMRGLKTALVEQADFAFGTSSRSSRLLHGGLRYLAQGRLRLVHEASREKRVIHRIAPHLADPLAFVFPTIRGTEWGWYKLSLGVRVYDLLCGRRNLGKSSSLLLPTLLWRIPSLEGTKLPLSGAVRYFDGFTNDARLVIDTLRSATNYGAVAANYTRFENASRKDDTWRCRLRHVESSEEFEVSAKQIVNATGPWSGTIPHSRTSLRLTKGVHLVIDRGSLPIDDAVVMADGSRILFCIPWGERVILGTTDTDYNGPIDAPDCTRGDIHEIMEVVSKTFPSAGITEKNILSVWSGLRPLVADRHGNPSDISRRHEILMGEPGWWDITGGKLTTYRLMAEQAVNKMVRFANWQTAPCRTATEPLLPASRTEGISANVPEEVSESLVRHFCRDEWAVHLDDVMVRRSSWRYYLQDPLEPAEDVAEWMAQELGWDERVKADELHRYRRLCENRGISNGSVNSPHLNGVGTASRNGR